MSSLLYPTKSKTVLFVLYIRSVLPTLLRLPNRLPDSYPRGIRGIWYVLTHINSLLKPTSALSSEELHAHLRAAFSITVASLPVLARWDAGAQKLLASVPRGLLCFEVPESEVIFWVDWDHRRLRSGWGKPLRAPDARVCFKSAQSALYASQQKLDELSAIGRGELEVQGFLPLADGLNGVMNRVAYYLNS